MILSYYREQLENFLKEIEVKAHRAVDVGGAEQLAKDRMKLWEVDEYRIFDLPDYDLNKQDASKEWRRYFNIALCLEVMEYIYDPVTAIKNLNELLCPQGLLVISFPFLYPIHNPVGMDYLRYTEEGARKLLEIGGFKIEGLFKRVHKKPEIRQAMYAADGMHTRHDETVNHTGYVIIARKNSEHTALALDARDVASLNRV